MERETIILTTAFNIAAAIAGLFAAWFWFKSAMLKPPSELSVSSGWGGEGTANTAPLVAFAKRSAQLNKIAAFLTGTAALLTGVATAAQQLAQWTTKLLGVEP
jgi:hypothetical protein